MTDTRPTAGPWPKPHRTEPRGEFPVHSPRPGRAVLSGPEAARIARERYEKWAAGK